MVQQKEYVILVDEQDKPVGIEEKLEAHRKGLLHRALSVLIYNSAGDMLIHKRATGKYHSPGLWTNACCSHPRPDEDILAAANRRLVEEMGFTTALSPLFTMLYRKDVGNGLIEHEYDHIFTGTYDHAPSPSPAEVEDWQYVPIATLYQNVKNHPEQFTEWFIMILEKLRASSHQ